MNPQHRFSPPAATARSRQRGVYALEWAIIFPVFFMLLYAIISFGLAFLVRESMQLAAEDGARAALRYQADRSKRQEEARTVVINKLDWLPSDLKPSTNAINVNVCQASDIENCSPTLICGIKVDERCMIRLDFSIPYGSAPLAPSLRMFGMDLLNPSELTANASILVDQGGI